MQGTISLFNDHPPAMPTPSLAACSSGFISDFVLAAIEHGSNNDRRKGPEEFARKMGAKTQIEDRSAGSYRSCLHRTLSPDPFT